MIVYIPPKWCHLASHSPGSRVTEPVSPNDLMPTVLSLAGIKPPSHVQGRALMGPHRAPAPKYVFGQRNRMDERYDFIRTITDTRFRYIRNYNPHRPWGQYVQFMFQAASYRDWVGAHLAGKLNKVQSRFWGEKPHEELYDSRADPHMVNNLAGDPAHAAKLAELRKALDAEMLRIVDNGFIPEGCAVQGYANSRRPGAYPLKEIMGLAGRAASCDPTAIAAFVKALGHSDEVMRYWGAQGLLMAGERARPQLGVMRAALESDLSVPVRIALAETLVQLANDRDALISLGVILDVEDDGPFRMQALNALTYLGEKARPVLPAIRRSAREHHRSVRKLAEHLIALLEGSFDPAKVTPSPGGGIFADPTRDSQPSGARPYD